jgi:hypothetical protein
MVLGATGHPRDGSSFSLQGLDAGTAVDAEALQGPRRPLPVAALLNDDSKGKMRVMT